MAGVPQGWYCTFGVVDHDTAEHYNEGKHVGVLGAVLLLWVSHPFRVHEKKDLGWILCKLDTV